KNAELGAEIALYIGQHRERKVFQVLVMSAPGMVDELGIGAAAEDLRVPIRELAVHLAEGSDLGGADKGEILRPKEVDIPLAFVVLVGDDLESRLDVAADSCRQRIRGKFFSYSDHDSLLSYEL